MENDMEKQLLKMKKAGAWWDEIVEWIMQQYGRDRETVEKAREIYFMQRSTDL